MRRWLWITTLITTAPLWALAVAPGEAARPAGTLTVAVATFAGERWLPHLYPGAKLDEFIERLAVEPNSKERVRIMRDEMGPWLHEYIPGVAIGAAHNIAGLGPKVGEWPVIPGHMGFHNWEYVTHAR